MHVAGYPTDVSLRELQRLLEGGRCPRCNLPGQLELADLVIECRACETTWALSARTGSIRRDTDPASRTFLPAFEPNAHLWSIDRLAAQLARWPAVSRITLKRASGA